MVATLVDPDWTTFASSIGVMDREPTLGELHDDIKDVKVGIEALRSSMVPKDLYTSELTGLRNEMRLEFTSVRTEMRNVDGKASVAQRLAMWALGIFTAAVLAGLVGFIVNLQG